MNLPITNEQFIVEYLRSQRDAYLAIVDNIERILQISPRTAELRRAEKERLLVLQLEAKKESNNV